MASLFAVNLHPDCTEATLYKKFSSAGKILNIHICRRNSSNKNITNYGYINFADKKVAANALESMNYDIINGLPIHLCWAKSNSEKSSSSKFNPSANICIKNLHESIDEKELFDIFSYYGNILSLKIATDKQGKSKGIGYLQFENEKSANEAIEAINEKLLKGTKVSVCKFLPKYKRCKFFTNIYLKYLPLSFTDKDLEDLCHKFGTIVSAKIMKDENEQSKGFGFVSFRIAESAKEAVEELNGQLIDNKKIYVDRAKTKTERQHELLENFWRKLQAENS